MYFYIVEMNIFRGDLAVTEPGVHRELPPSASSSDYGEHIHGDGTDSLSARYQIAAHNQTISIQCQSCDFLFNTFGHSLLGIL